LYKDIFIFENIRHSKLFEDLLRLLAVRVGGTVATHDLATALGTSSATVERYLRLLEQSYVIRRIYSFARNFANELKKSYKVYFYDVGIRNVLAEEFGSIESRLTKGVMFENFCFSEKFKSQTLEIFPPRIFFWRTRQGFEIDMVLEKGNEILAYECKWSNQSVSFSLFLKHYPHAKVGVVFLESFL
jgi:predicted AAA+ superfamily ATPase